MFHICSLSTGHTSVPIISRMLGWTQEEAYAARTVLESLGLLASQSKAPLENEALPSYTSREITVYIDSDESFKSLVDYTKIRLGKLLTNPDVNILLGLYSHLGMPAGVLMLLISHCVELTKLKNGETARVSMKYIEREGYYWYRNGITTEVAADEYIRRKNNEAEKVNSLARLLQIRDRKPTSSETKYLSLWAGYGMDDSLLYSAYDKTVLNTGSLKWNYMNTILADWDSKNIRTLNDLETKDRPINRASTAENNTEQTSGNAAERLRRMRSTKKDIK